MRYKAPGPLLTAASPCLATLDGFQRGDSGPSSTPPYHHRHSNRELALFTYGTARWFDHGRRCHMIRAMSARTAWRRHGVGEPDTAHGCHSNDVRGREWDSLGLDTGVSLVP
ncbi:hypothetical protein EJB05_21893, partial [Eragrostis curvula]